MSLSRRDEFAKAALAGLLANRDYGEMGAVPRAALAVENADALLQALGEEKEDQPEGAAMRIQRLVDANKSLERRLAVREAQVTLAMRALDQIVSGIFTGVGARDAAREIQAMEKELE